MKTDLLFEKKGRGRLRLNRQPFSNARIRGFGFAFLGLILVSLIVFSGRVMSQESGPILESEWKRGYHGVHVIGTGIGLIHQDLNDWQQRPASESVLVVLGELENLPVNVSQFIDRGGAVLLASDKDAVRAVAPHGLSFHAADVNAQHAWNSYGGFGDCPIITDLDFHPIFDGVRAIVANRPGVLRRQPVSEQVRVVARFPVLNRRIGAAFFVGALNNRNGGKMVGVADQSMFSNQMLTVGDNAQFTLQVLKWLKGPNRKYLLVLVDAKVESSINPAEILLMPPPPTRDEILRALDSMPPSALLEFGNSVATMVEDDNMVNEFLIANMKKIPPQAMKRFLVFTTFGVVCLVFMMTFLFQKKLMRSTASDAASKRFHGHRKNQKRDQALERQMAAEALLDIFCIRHTNRRFREWPSFPTGIPSFESTPPDLRNQMELACRQVKNKRKAFWSRERLEQLEKMIVGWESDLQSKGNPGSQEMRVATLDNC